MGSLGFLAPLYVAAGLAVGLPILFHLIRRTPKGRQDFSSVMFLSPSPPRITRRSRIEHWLLLLLRGLAVLLIVAAFCRPLWRKLQSRPDDGRGREIVLLLDTSASLQRAGLWDEAQRLASDRIAALSPADNLALLAFDDQVRPILDRPEWTELDPAQRSAVAAARLAELRPGWGRTHLDRALSAAADRLEQSEAGSGPTRQRQVWVISDLQAGSHWQGLQGREWPSGVEVELIRVGESAAPTNAGVQLVGQPQAGEPPFVRIRVTNAADSQRERFQLGWRGAFDDPQSSGPTSGIVEVYVPPGQSRVVRLPQAGDDLSAVRVALAGDDHPFDNQCSVTWPQRQTDRVIYLGSDAPDDRLGLRVFLPALYAATPEREVELLDQFPAAPATGTKSEATTAGDATLSLVIAAGAIAADRAAVVRDWLQGGGAVLYVCRDAESAAALYDLAGVPPQPITEAATADYAMLREVDFRHPLFRMLDDPRYSDLSKVHFWKHRILPAEALPGAQVLARFDDGAPALLEAPVGQGRLLILTSGWNRGDSELATWSKFIPIMHALLESARPRAGGVSQLIVGDALPWDALRGSPVAAQVLVTPDQQRVDWSGLSAETRLSEPGLYRVYGPETAASTEATVRPTPLATIAVNLPPEESQTSPLGTDVLDSLGVALDSDVEDPAAVERRQAQLASSELESQQKLWRWLLGVALAVLFLETILAARPQRAPAVDGAANA